MACIYKIICKDNSITDCYIGSTTDFRRRGLHHNKRCSNINNPKYNCKVYKFIRDNGGWDNWDMLKLEDCEVENKLQLERKYYDDLNSTLNSMRPFVSKEERRIANSKTTKLWYIKNEKENKIKRKAYELKNKDKIAKNRIAYNLKNKDKIEKRRKEYRLKNKDKIAKRRKELRDQKKLLKK
tara:strand:- start:52 stop:597 length:546 start_codon:yes stop_codon:yes gene_type:complete